MATQLAQKPEQNVKKPEYVITPPVDIYETDNEYVLKLISLELQRINKYYLNNNELEKPERFMNSTPATKT
jgi:hypothetical protein